MKRILSLITLLAIFVAFTACGKNAKKIVSDIEFETRDQDEQKYVVSDFALDLGSAELPFLHLPLPKDYGYLRLYRSQGVNHVAVDVNLTEILKLPAGEATLPNGTMVPVDTMGAGIIEIPVGGINGKVYVSHKDDMTLVGFAISIKQLDGVGNSIGTIGVFPNFDIKGVNITAGVYSSEDRGQTGIAAFANLGGLWNVGKEVAYNREAFTPIQEYVPAWKERLLGRRLLRIKNIQQTLELAEEL